MVNKYIKSTIFDQTHPILISETWLTPHVSGKIGRLGCVAIMAGLAQLGQTGGLGTGRQDLVEPAVFCVKINGWAPVMFVNVS